MPDPGNILGPILPFDILAVYLAMWFEFTYRAGFNLNSTGDVSSRTAFYSAMHFMLNLNEGSHFQHPDFTV